MYRICVINTWLNDYCTCYRAIVYMLWCCKSPDYTFHICSQDPISRNISIWALSQLKYCHIIFGVNINTPVCIIRKIKIFRNYFSKISRTSKWHFYKNSCSALGWDLLWFEQNLNFEMRFLVLRCLNRKMTNTKISILILFLVNFKEIS